MYIKILSKRINDINIILVVYLFLFCIQFFFNIDSVLFLLLNEKQSISLSLTTYINIIVCINNSTIYRRMNVCVWAYTHIYNNNNDDDDDP